MSTVYYTSMNLKNWLAFSLLVLSFPLLFVNIIYSVIVLVLVTILFDGIVSYDMVVSKEKKLYLITKQTNVNWNLIGFFLLISAFVCTIGHMYFYGVLLFYAVYFYIFLGNILKSRIIKKVNVDGLFIHRNYHYFVYEVDKVLDYDKNRFELEMHNKYDKTDEMDLVFYVSKLFIHYKEVYH